MSRAVRISEHYAAAWLRGAGGLSDPWLLQIDPATFLGLPIGAAFEVPDQHIPR